MDISLTVEPASFHRGGRQVLGKESSLISSSGAVASSGAKFNNGDRIQVTNTGGQKGWNIYASDGTYITEPNGKQGTVQSSTPVFIRGYERVPVKFDGETAIRWVADDRESLIGGAAAATATAAPTTTTTVAPKVSMPSIASAHAFSDVSIGDAKKDALSDLV